MNMINLRLHIYRVKGLCEGYFSGFTACQSNIYGAGVVYLWVIQYQGLTLSIYGRKIHTLCFIIRENRTEEMNYKCINRMIVESF